MQAIQVSNILVSAINLADTGFRISRADDHQVSALAASMAANGMAVPPLVAAAGNDTYVVVSGFKRLEAAVLLGWETIPCRTMGGKKEKELAGLAVAENAFQRELGPGEQVRAVGLLARYMDAKQISKNAEALFNTRLNAGYIQSLVRINALPDPAKALLDNGLMSVKAGKSLVACAPEEAAAFLDLFGAVKVSSSKQMEIITWIREICAREKGAVADFCRDIVFSVPSGDKGHKDLSAAGNLLRASLYRRRYPALDHAKKQAMDHVQALKLPKGVRITLPENFESMVYSLSLSFTNYEEFQGRIDAVAKLSGADDFNVLLKR